MIKAKSFYPLKALDSFKSLLKIALKTYDFLKESVVFMVIDYSTTNTFLINCRLFVINLFCYLYSKFYCINLHKTTVERVFRSEKGC